MGKLKEKFLQESDEAEERFLSGKDNERAFRKRMRSIGHSTAYIEDRIDALRGDWGDE